MNPMPESEFQAFRQQCNWFLRQEMERNRNEFGLDGFKRFDWDPWRGELVFSEGGIPKVVGRVQVAGVLSPKMKTWTWAWAIPGLLAPVRQSVLKVREWGEERHLLTLVQPRWAAAEQDAWHMTAITAKLTEARGGFKCPGPELTTFLVFTDLRAVSDRKRVFGARTCSHVFDGDRPILLVSRERDGEVLAVCGGEDDTPEALLDLPLDKLLGLDSTLSALAGMPDGWAALRESPETPWQPSKSE